MDETKRLGSYAMNANMKDVLKKIMKSVDREDMWFLVYKCERKIADSCWVSDCFFGALYYRGNKTECEEILPIHN